MADYTYDGLHKSIKIYTGRTHCNAMNSWEDYVENQHIIFPDGVRCLMEPVYVNRLILVGWWAKRGQWIAFKQPLLRHKDWIMGGQRVVSSWIVKLGRPIWRTTREVPQSFVEWLLREETPVDIILKEYCSKTNMFTLTERIEMHDGLQETEFFLPIDKVLQGFAPNVSGDRTHVGMMDKPMRGAFALSIATICKMKWQFRKLRMLAAETAYAPGGKGAKRAREEFEDVCGEEGVKKARGEFEEESGEV